MSAIARTPSTDPPLFETHSGPFPVGAVLECAPGDAVVFMRAGSPLGTLGPGRHALDPRAVPFLSHALQNDAMGLPWVGADAMFLRTEGASLRCEGPAGSVRDANTNLTVNLTARVRFGVRVDNPITTAFGLASTGDPASVATWLGDNVMLVLREHVKTWSEPVSVGDLAFGAPLVDRAPAVIVAQATSSFAPYGLVLESAMEVQLEVAHDDQARWSAAVEAKSREVLSSASAGAASGVACVACGAPMPGPAKFCTACGAAQSRRCACGAPLAAGAKFCMDCGART